MPNSKKVVIVGGGFGGLTLAKCLKNKDLQITIIDKQNHHLFQPLLYQVATAALSPGDIAMPLREIFKKNEKISVLMGEVVSIDKVQKQITLKNGDQIPFDYLILACGAKHSYFGKPQWEEFAPGLKTIKDALSIRENILLSFEKAERLGSFEESAKYLNFVVIGGGPTGVEMAGAIAEIAKETLFKNFRKIQPEKSQIYLIEALPRILPVYPEKLSERAKRDLEKLGVKVLNNKMVTQITKDGVEIEGQFIPSCNVIWAAGNQAAAVLKTLDSPLDKQGRAIVEKDLSIPNHSNIFVIGDAACALDKNGKPLPGIAPVAMQQARYLAKLLNHLSKERKPFSYFDKGSMATIGKAKAVASSFGINFGGIFAWLAWCFLHIFYLIGFKNRLSVMLQWFIHYLSGSRGARIIYRSIDDELPKNSKSPH
jgi:NADH dehydrogenase